MRYSGDDYCYAAYSTRLGFLRDAWISFFSVSDYNGNRFSLTFFSALVDQFHPRANGVLPGVAILLLISGMVFLILAVIKLGCQPILKAEILALAIIIVFFTLFEAPDLAQILYWRSGMLPYLAPIITGTFLLALIVWQAQAKKISWLVLVGVFLLAWIGGGFSETAVALQITTLLLFLLWVVLPWRRKDDKGKRMGVTAASGLLGSLIAMMLLILSPSNLPRLANLPSHPGWLDFLSMILNDSRIFISWSIKTLYLPNLIMILIIGILSVRIHQDQPKESHSTPRRLVVKLILVPVLTEILILACCAPSAYIRSEYPELRALITARIVMVGAAACFAWFMGEGTSLIINRFKPSLTKWLPMGAILSVVLGIYPLMATTNILADLPRFERWAYFWDQRDRQIRIQKQNGVLDLQVVQIDHIIPRVAELSPDENYWYNNCAEAYYGVHSIRANQPGWDNQP